MEAHDHNDFLKFTTSKEPRWKKEFPYISPDITLSFTPEGIIMHRERYGQTEKVTTLELTELCITLFSEHFYKDKFNVFKSVFEDDLKDAIEKVLRFYSMRTSKKNHRKFAREIKERKKL